MTIPHKTCYICKKALPATPEYFTRDKTRSDGLHPYCKACRNAKRTERRRENPRLAQKARERARRWFYENREQARRKRKAQYWGNPQKAIDDVRRWREENPERYRESSARHKYRHYRQNREKYNTYVRNRRARLRNAEGTHTASDIQRMYDEQDGKCHYCGSSLVDGFHVDHVIPISRGGSNSPENLVLTCPTCNLSKNDRLPDEWIGPIG